MMIRSRIFARFQSSQRKIANLGSIVEYLRNDGIINLLDKNFEQKYIDENIRLRILYLRSNNDLINHYNICSGRRKYNGSINVVRLIMNNFLFDRKPHLHILSTETVVGQKAPSKTYEYVTDNDKIVIRWQTCVLNDNKTRYHRDGRYTKNNMHHLLQPHLVEKIRTQDETKLKDNDTRMDDGKNISGKFIFEFNDDNSKILVHTIENIEIIKNKNYSKLLSFSC
ncbi:hypothetical protein TPHA_0J00700 [Tetrapisispora phaffii CBS 4417]|uniref:Uncharacterized protein n=1 Tax=Tetrapisispora phaffii (strain ATCC 24235 / CBS 4417 / NBRC 1672 / NRRL Y-8282 / UCD 70-5) TaxID=1071381 RepID=G8BYF1_TETPH|nr:hypothetical protein TPHA_0J00700 [Tetrapisispora phaffii CBS 4417]CCE64893.1 hypothetical protein TPHA_0J00700 [Tetrapisispora phaffii CBS 4417]